MCMHHVKSLLNTCIVPTLIDVLLGCVTLIPYDFGPRELHMLLVQMAAPAGSESFLMMFGTHALLWRVFHYAGYQEPPLYYWNEVYLEGQQWYEVRLTIPARTQAPFWQEWKVESEGRTPWEDAQVVAFEVLSQIYQQHGDELTGSVAGTFPRVDPSTAIWAQHNCNALI